MALQINYGYGVEIDRHLLSLGESFKAQSKGDLRILLNHIGVLERSYNQYEKVRLSLFLSIHEVNLSILQAQS